MKSMYLRKLVPNILFYFETTTKWYRQGMGPPFCTARFAKTQLDYKTRFQAAFWSVIDKDVNGISHCQFDYTNGRVTPRVSWSCYKLKRVRSAKDYEWRQPSLHITWPEQPGRDVVYIFDFLPSTEQMGFLRSLPSPKARRHNPFSWHAAFARVVLKQYEEALWEIRDLVRNHEKSRETGKSVFQVLNDTGRHSVHYQETIEVATNTLRRLIQELVRWRAEGKLNVESDISHWFDAHQVLLLHEQTASALKARSKSLNDRLLNEINLNFNLVLQADSTMMKTIAFVTMVYLPGTFVSGLFGTNFFSFEPSTPDEWAQSHFWLYWAVAVPLTMLTMGVWAAWYWRTSIQDEWVACRDWMKHRFSTEDEDSGSHKTETELSIMSPGQPLGPTTAMNQRNVRRQEAV
ncbi:uncharacterized protein BDV14DRAFT_207545 [Aspergillus stella-maris]|uniref:uncharacterized protein n=1 Tax=Aspergillus stella-maris TaxID=1810926 RepID=UPI003CCD9289